MPIGFPNTEKKLDYINEYVHAESRVNFFISI